MENEKVQTDSISNTNSKLTKEKEGVLNISDHSISEECKLVQNTHSELLYNDHEDIEKLIIEYLEFRGFIQTCYTFHREIKNQPTVEMQADLFLTEFVNRVASGSVEDTTDYWDYLKTKYFFTAKEISLQRMAAFLDSEWKKYFLVIALKSQRASIIQKFLERNNYLSEKNDWIVWFSLPYISNPENHPTFSHYLSRVWEQQFLSTLRNFLCTLFSNVLLSIKEPWLSSLFFWSSRENCFENGA